jgi:hypothetical protein
MTRGSIYQAKSKASGKCYIGQTQDTKEREGKPYRYGASGRWSDHVSSAYRGAKTPLAQAILEFGADDFELTTLEVDISEEMLDEREAHWIATRKTTVPDGFNVMRHARCKHRTDSTLADHYLPTTTKVRITSVKRGGSNKLVYVYLDQNTGEPVRLVFGQGASASYAEALLEAQEFATIFATSGIEVYEEESEDPLRKYREKVESIRSNKVERIRIAKFNHLVALHIKHNEGTLRICFGGKTIPLKDAYKTAKQVKDLLMETHTGAILQDDVSESATGDCH